LQLLLQERLTDQAVGDQSDLLVEIADILNAQRSAARGLGGVAIGVAGWENNGKAKGPSHLITERKQARTLPERTTLMSMGATEGSQRSSSSAQVPSSGAAPLG
jgi:hypothetical protein